MMELIARQKYIERVQQWLGKGLIIVLTGQRRVGKSCLLKLLAASFSNDSNVIYIDKEKREFNTITNHEELSDYIEERIKRNQRNVIMIDEVQDISEFEHSLRSYYSEPDTDIIITGSNAKMLSSELTTLIAGRFKEIYIQPLEYTEFLQFHTLEESESSLSSYIEYGGMPGLASVGLDKSMATDYLNDIYSTTLLRDVVMRNEIRNVSFLDKLVRFMADNEGKLFSANNISKYMKSKGDTLSPSIITNYQRVLSEAFMIHRVSRFDIHGKRIFETNDKYYFEDHGIRNAIAGGTREGDIEKVMENIVYHQLVRMGYDVHVGQLQAGEIDFVCTKPTGDRVYVQVAYIIADDATREREFGNLRKINDNYGKYVISMTPLVSRNDNNGITHLHLRKFLVEGF
ncbi:MAG: ATP-binding protein [Prevotella sp.]|nr:ATP-binding protein [Prevotella sp.]